MTPSTTTPRVKLVDENDIEVPAGAFRARHFRIASDVLDVPPSDLWVTGEDNLLVRYAWEKFDLEYVLANVCLEMGEIQPWVSDRNPQP